MDQRSPPGPAASVATPRISLRIDELELQGFRPGHRYAIAEAVQAELQRLLADRPPPGASHQAPSSTVEATGLRADASPASIGTAIARALIRALPPG